MTPYEAGRLLGATLVFIAIGALAVRLVQLRRKSGECWFCGARAGVRHARECPTADRL